MKNWFKLFFYSSILFLLIALIRSDYLKVPEIKNYIYLSLSFILLFLGFIYNGISWRQVLTNANYQIYFNHAISSFGLSVFGKYIPGKLWIILGRAEYITQNYRFPRKDISILSLNTQLISLWIGLLIGTIGMIAINEINIYGLSVFVLFLVLSLTIFTPFFHNIGEYLLSKVFKKTISLPKLSFTNAIKVLPWFIFYWCLLCISFYFLANSLTEQEVSFNVAWGFGLATAIGIIAIIAPGGIGVREGLLTGYLTLTGLDIQNATTIAVASRLWFLTGEVFIFLLALVLDKTSKKASLSTTE